MGVQRNAAAIAACMLLIGCATPPVNWKSDSDGNSETFRQVMSRRDVFVHLSSDSSAPAAPVLILLHGASEDPTEMMDIARRWRTTYDVFLFSYNFHENVKKLSALFVNELKGFRTAHPCVGPITVVVYSYSAVIFRAAVVLTSDPALFNNVSLVQITPTAGGSRLATLVRFAVARWLISMSSQPSAAENPYGRFADTIWGTEGTRRFNAAISPQRVHTIIVQDDRHSLASVKDKQIHQHYVDAIGTNVVLIPSDAGVSHDYFPVEPASQKYLDPILGTSSAPATRTARIPE